MVRHPRLKLQPSSVLLHRQSTCGLSTSKFNGVHWDKRSQKFQATVSFNGTKYFVGRFQSEVRAAHAYDERLRELCPGSARLKRSLNFPTQAEDLFNESALQARSRALAAHQACTEDAEAESVRRLQNLFRSSAQALDYEIKIVAGCSRIDALFRPKGSCLGGLCLQIKSATSRGASQASYHFQRVQGYEGMLLLLIPRDLEHDVLWALAGSSCVLKSATVTLGTSRDKMWRVHDIGRTLEECFHQADAFPHCTLGEAALHCRSANHRVEQQAHQLMANVLACAQLKLRKSTSLLRHTVDSVLSLHSTEWNVQEKASTLQKAGGGHRYAISLQKHGGAMGRLAYTQHDFDLLLAAILDDGMLLGMFVFPTGILAARGLVGHKPTRLVLYPPWKMPVSSACKVSASWQLDHFVDLRACRGRHRLPPVARTRLLEVFGRLGCHKPSR